MPYASILARVALTLISAVSVAAEYQIGWHSINSGGGRVIAKDLALDSTISQRVVGLVQGADLLQWVGFRSAEAPTPTVLAYIPSVKWYADGTFVSTASKISTCDCAYLLYLEESDRSTGCTSLSLRARCPMDRLVAAASIRCPEGRLAQPME